MKKRILIICFAIFSKFCFSQTKKQIYFFADTINVKAENRILEIGKEGAWVYYVFFCKCIKEYDRNPTFIYLARDEKQFKKGVQNFEIIAWRDLSELISLYGKNFNNAYTLSIIEKLKDNAYKLNEVKLFITGTTH